VHQQGGYWETLEVKVLIPDLPTADDLLPWIRRIDANKQYSNGGPLVRELESRLDGVLVSSATLGLELAAKVLFRGPVRIPAFTFAATATALIRAGLEPVLCDVDRDTWAIEGGDDCLAVCPFGAPVSPGKLVDAASAWGNGQTGNRVYSLHATKAFGVGEGGLVCGDPDLLYQIRYMSNFGLHENVLTFPDGTNAKMSEYHAAVGLAQLERMPAIVKKRQALEVRYRENLEGVVESQKRPIGNYSIFPVLVPERERVANELASYGIETRSWYCPTLDMHPLTANLRTSSGLKVANLLSRQVLCLPMHSFVTEEDCDSVCDRLRSAVRNRRPLRAA